jgi:hypothetical protein
MGVFGKTFSRLENPILDKVRFNVVAHWGYG